MGGEDETRTMGARPTEEGPHPNFELADRVRFSAHLALWLGGGGIGTSGNGNGPWS